MFTGAGAVALSIGFVVSGGIATAVGAIGLYWGGAIASRGDAAAIQDRLEGFMQRLDGLRNEASHAHVHPPGSADSLKKIEDDFSEWANEFAENRHFRQLQYTQSNLGRQTVAAEMTVKWRPFLQRILDLLTNTITAYNERLGCAVQADLPGIPDDLFAKPYRGAIRFAAKTVWRLQTEITHPPRSTSRLSLWIYFEQEGQSLSSTAANIIIDIKANEFEMFAHGAAVPVDIDMVGTPLTEFNDKMSRVIRQLVEAQLMERADE